MEVHSGLSCRICKSRAGQDLMKSPCLCKGTLGYVHFTCLEEWLNQASRDYCELCNYRFQASQSRRYSLLQSLGIWVRNRTNRTYLCYDVLIAVVLTALTVSIVFICLVGAGISSREEGAGLEDPFVRVIIMVFLIILLVSYITTIYLIIQDHIKPWYHWWRNCVNVQLLIDPNKFVSTMHSRHADKITPPSELQVVEIHSKELLSLTHSDSNQSVKIGRTLEASTTSTNIEKKDSNTHFT